MKLKLIILLLIPSIANGLTVDEWLVKYKRPCKSVATNQVCKGRLDASLQKMKNSVVPELLKNNGLPIWISTLGIVESDYNSEAISKAGAVGVLQVLPINVQKFFTKERTITTPMRTEAGIKFVETIIITKPTIKACKELAKNTEINTMVSIWLLKELYDRYGDWKLVLMAYNSGQPRIDKYLKGEGDPLTFETLNYFTQLMAIQKYIEGIQ